MADTSVLVTTGISVAMLLIGAGISVYTQVILSSSAEKRERDREIWRRDVELCRQTDELAGSITDRLTGYALRSDGFLEVGALCLDLALLSGKLPRHSAIQSAIRDLHNTASMIVQREGHFDSRQEREETVAELRSRCDRLLPTTGKVLGQD